MIADFGQQQWSCTNFWISDRKLRSRDRILEFSQKLVKICATANNFDIRIYFGMSARYKQPVWYGRDAAHKSRAAWAVSPLGVYMSERQHIYENLNESSSASPGGSQRALTVSGPPTFSTDISLGAEISTPSKILSPAYISARYQHFINPPTICVSANILEDVNILQSANIFMRRQHFGNPPILSWDASILEIRLYFHETPIFWDSAYIL
jgi:hypothetical protein